MVYLEIGVTFVFGGITKRLKTRVNGPNTPERKVVVAKIHFDFV